MGPGAEPSFPCRSSHRPGCSNGLPCIQTSRALTLKRLNPQKLRDIGTKLGLAVGNHGVIAFPAVIVGAVAYAKRRGRVKSRLMSALKAGKSV